MSLPTKRRRSKKRTKEEKIREFKIGIEKVRMEKLRSQRGCYSQFLSPIVALLSPLPSRLSATTRTSNSSFTWMILGL